MKKSLRLNIILIFGLYLVIGIASALTTVDDQVVPIDWGTLAHEFPGSIGDILGSILVRGVLPVLLWPFRFFPF
jgi:hypothetical protein